MNIPQPVRIAAAAVSILAVTAVAFLPSLQNGFVTWDDDLYVIQNPVIKDIGARNIKKIFSSFFVGNYQPLTILTYGCDHMFSGADPWAYHATNLLLHLANCLAVFWLIALISGRWSVAFVVGILFGIHPLHVESVAWVSERKDVLYGFFFLTALICYVLYLRSGRLSKHYFFALGLFLLSLLSKSMAVTLPFVLVLLDRFCRRDTRRALSDKIPFFALSLVFAGLAFFAQSSSGAVRHEVMFHWVDRWLVAHFAVGFYVIKTLLPFGLTSLYPYGLVRGTPSFFFMGTLTALLYVAGFALFLFRTRLQRLIFGFLFFIVTVLPVIQLIPFGGSLVADRYAYIPSVGILYGLGEFYHWLRARRWQRGRWLIRPLVTGALVGMMFFWGVSTWRQCGIWKDGETLWRHVLEHNPGSLVALNNLGQTYNGLGRYEEAVPFLEKAARGEVPYAEAHVNLCLAYYRLGRTEEAIAACERALDINADCPKAYNNLGNIYYDLGAYEKARSSFAKSLELDPDFALGNRNLGSLYFVMGRPEEALVFLKKAVFLDPADPQSHNSLGAVYMALGQVGRGIDSFQRAIESDPRCGPAYRNASRAYLESGDHERAAAYYSMANVLGCPDPALYEKIREHKDAAGRSAR